MRRALPVLALAVLTAAPAAAAAEARSDASAARSSAVAWAEQQAGHRERGTTNCSARIVGWERDMGFRVPPCKPWCGAIVHQAFLRAGIRLSARLIDPAKVYADAKAGRRNLRAIGVDQVRKGDLLLFAFQRGKVASHIALVRGRPVGGRAPTIEGNVGHTAVLARRGVRYAVLGVRVVP